jgi:MYXO-CTERM domain-containing protein
MPSTASVPPRGSVSFSANGGTAPYAFDLAANGSNGIVGAGGAYVAGPKGSVTDTVRVTDSGGKTQTALVQVGPEISIAPASGTIALGGTQDFTATGGNDGPYSWNASAGTIDGAGHFTAPNVSGSVTIGASDSLGNTAFVVFAVGTGLAIVKTPAQSFPKGTVVFTASGGSQTGFTWSLVTAPAAGGSIDSATGQFTAGPTANVTETIKVTDSVGGSATTTLDIGPGLSLTPASATATPGQHISFAASGGSGVGISFALEASPSGGTLDGTGVYIAGTISGTDVVKVVDSVGNVARANVTVNGAPPPLDAGIGDDAGTIADAGAHPDAATTTTPPPVPPGAGTTPPGANPTKPGAIDIGPPGTGGGEDCTMHGAPSGSSGVGGFFLMALAALGRRRRHRR